jgi:hypothetical protein
MDVFWLERRGDAASVDVKSEHCFVADFSIKRHASHGIMLDTSPPNGCCRAT